MQKLLIFSCVLLLCGCAGRMGKNVHHYDKIEATQVHQLVRNNLTQSPFDQEVVYLNARCEMKKDGGRRFYLVTEMIPPPDFTLQPGESLILNLDNQIFTSAPTNAPSFNGRKRFTTTFYSVNNDVLTKLAAAKEANVRIKGTTMVIDKPLSQRNILRFSEFASRCSSSNTFGHQSVTDILQSKN